MIFRQEKPDGQLSEFATRCVAPARFALRTPQAANDLRYDEERGPEWPQLRGYGAAWLHGEIVLPEGRNNPTQSHLKW